jgi:translation initiation factor IF-2
VRSVAAPAPVLRRSALPIMVTAIGISALLASAAIVVVARHQIAVKDAASIEPAASAVLGPAPLGAAAGQPPAFPQPVSAAASTPPAPAPPEGSQAPGDSASAQAAPAAPSATAVAPSSTAPAATAPSGAGYGKALPTAGARQSAPGWRADRPGPGF